MWPCFQRPLGPPNNPTSASRAASADAAGQGWPGLQLPSVSRAAMPAIRIFCRSSQRKVSPSHTATGVQTNSVSAACQSSAAEADDGAHPVTATSPPARANPPTTLQIYIVAITLFARRDSASFRATPSYPISSPLQASQPPSAYRSGQEGRHRLSPRPSHST